MKKLLFVLLIVGQTLSAQTGTISGLVLDESMNNEPLAFANVIIKGQAKGTTTDFDGKFELSNLTPGQYILVFSFVGYESKESPSIQLDANENEQISISLTAQGTSLNEVIVTTVAKKETEAALLSEQKEAVSMEVAIGASEISRKGVSDVATAVTKTSGISKQEGSGGIYVRGLGDRYNITTINGLPVPSNNPRNKNIDLGIFSTKIVQNIAIGKTYNAKNYGDFSGANINIIPKIHSGAPYVSIGISGRANSNAISANNFRLQQGPGALGFTVQQYPSNPLDSYQFDTNKTQTISAPFDKRFFIDAGKTFYIGSSSLNAFVTVSHSNDFNNTSGVKNGNINAQNVKTTEYTFNKYERSTKSTVMLSLMLTINPNHSLKLISMYVNSSNQSFQDFRGTVNVFDVAPNGGGVLLRSQFNKTAIWVNQLIGDAILNDNLDFHYAIGYNTSNNNIPNRKQNILVPRDDDDFSKGLVPSNFASSHNNRYFQNLKENEFSANLVFTCKLGVSETEDGVKTQKGKIDIGYSGRFKTVDFDVTQFNLAVNRSAIQPSVTEDNLDAYFNQSNLDNNLFSLSTFRGNKFVKNALTPQTYSGTQNIHAFFATNEYKWLDKLVTEVGVRGEIIEQLINWKTQLDPSGDESLLSRFEFLPSLSAKYALNDQQNLKLALSKTYTLPQFKERAPFQFDVITQVEFGNADLYSSTDYNADIKWEMFPNVGELISFTGFGKYIQNPINEVVVLSATNDISFINTGNAAVVAGIEAEVRKKIYQISDSQKITGGANVSYMYSNQDFDGDKVNRENTTGNLNVLFTHDNGPLTGASDLLVNLDIGYKNTFNSKTNLLTTLAYNYFSDRLYAIGSSRVGNQYDSAVGTLDFISKLTLNKSIKIGLTVKNILNPKVERYQDNIGQKVLISSYTKGINAGLSLSYTF